MLDRKLAAAALALAFVAAAAIACKGQIGPGSMLAPGAAGTSGTAGTTGAAGTTPVAGTSGAAGRAGAAGTSGAAGTTGAAGRAGAAGKSGAAGTTGAAGTSGAAGTTGGASTSGTTAYWQPHPGTSWQIQLQGNLDTSISASAYDIDLFDNSASTIATLHAAGRKVICYFSAGSYEDWRSDAGQFPAAALGNPLDGWPGENWLDTRSAAVRTIMQARMDLAVTKGCDAVDPDNVDGYTNNPGFPLTAATQLDYDTFLATSAHARGLAVGLKNDLDQVPSLVTSFDFAVNEQCEQYSECGLLKPFISANKSVFGIEYQGTVSSVCPTANADNFDTLIKTLALDATRTPCR
jgi:hypothetical protein